MRLARIDVVGVDDMVALLLFCVGFPRREKRRPTDWRCVPVDVFAADPDMDRTPCADSVCIEKEWAH